MDTNSPTTPATAAAAATAAASTATTTAPATGSTAASTSSSSSSVSLATAAHSSASTSAAVAVAAGAVAGVSTCSAATAGAAPSPVASSKAGACAVSVPLAATPTSALLAQPQLLTAAAIVDASKQEDVNNLSLASGLSEGQRSLSGAPSASSSPILSPQGKIFGRNANGTMITTSRPGNEAEVQLYRVLQRASLLAYYDTLLEMGGDDVQQLYDAGEEEFLEIMALVGMASKPLHVRRLQKALHEWANNPSLFQGPLLSHIGGLCETPTKPAGIVFNPDARHKFPAFNPASSFQPTALLNPNATQPSGSGSAGAAAAAAPNPAQLLSQLSAPVMSVPVIQTHSSSSSSASSMILPNVLGSNPAGLQLSTPPQQQTSSVVTGTSGGAASTAHQVSSSSPQLTPVLTELQVQRITLGAEKIARQLPQREPRAQTSKKRTTRELEQVIAMSENDPRRMDEIRKYSAIYGRFDCKRRPEKPLTLHEVCVNEAAAQLCRLVPALLTRRDELFPLARQIVKDAGFGHSASIARYGGLLTQMQAQCLPRASNSGNASSVSCGVADCESSDAAALPMKRQRLSSTEAAAQLPLDVNREALEDSRYNLFAMYQKFAKPPFDLTEIAKYSLGKSEYDDNDNDSRFSFSNSSSPPMPTNGAESERCSNAVVMPRSSPLSQAKSSDAHELLDTVDLSGNSTLSGVQVISAAGGNIIAVANPALALSPTLNEVLALKRNATSPEV